MEKKRNKQLVKQIDKLKERAARLNAQIEQADSAIRLWKSLRASQEILRSDVLAEIEKLQAQLNTQVLNNGE